MSGIIFKLGDESVATINIDDGETRLEGGKFIATHVGPMDTDQPHYAHITTYENDDRGLPQRGWQLTLHDGDSEKITFLEQPGTLTHLERGQ